MAPRQARALRDQGGDHPQALRRHLIDVTQRLVAAQGLAGLTTRTIAREAQVADGVLYNHFADKDDLVVAALQERVLELGGRFARDCPRAGEQDLEAGLTAVVEQCRRFGSDALPIVAGLVGRPDLLHELFARLHGPDGQMPAVFWGSVVGYLSDEQARGTISGDVRPATLATIILGATQLDALMGPITRGALEPDPARSESAREASVADLVAVLMRACRA